MGEGRCDRDQQVNYQKNIFCIAGQEKVVESIGIHVTKSYNLDSLWTKLVPGSSAGWRSSTFRTILGAQ